MSTANRIALIVLIIFVGIQFVPTVTNQSNGVPKTDFMLVNKVPDLMGSKIKNSCYDCHSNNTEYPWYNKLQPVAWLLERHIEQGKGELNFSKWSNYSSRRKNSKLKSIINQIQDNEMPLWSYTLMHRDARLSEKEKKEVITYMSRIKNNL